MTARILAQVIVIGLLLFLQVAEVASLDTYGGFDESDQYYCLITVRELPEMAMVADILLKCPGGEAVCPDCHFIYGSSKSFGKAGGTESSGDPLHQVGSNPQTDDYTNECLNGIAREMRIAESCRWNAYLANGTMIFDANDCGIHWELHPVK
ncbi:hypothetical protein FOL47_002819 [Perkinsus chesapeaki]|uniref:Secreted protein n=1 Tax=Perkinsus chesapeaki TaxID=330153 RepID=A0A7J6MBD5_PERCH|nr:hypothetical protein FOL47_002819 [Perkinsus chesapeaki]